MYEKRDGSGILATWFCLHVIATMLTFIKLCGGIPDWPWWIVLAPFIFDLVLFSIIISGICILFFFSTIYHRNR